MFSYVPICFRHAKVLIEDTIKRNASPVREMGVGNGVHEVAGSNSSINSSASDECNLLHNSGKLLKIIIEAIFSLED